jgi:hypothetical protein
MAEGRTMTVTAMMMTAATIAAAGAQPRVAPQNAAPGNARKLTVCMNEAAGAAPAMARKTVSQMFAGIGVTIDWRTQRGDCPADALKIRLSNKTEETLRPGALAYALPYEGTHIVVFYDRIQQMGNPRFAPRVMAHVIVHEITHITERVARHSSEGVMKARWSGGDLRVMERKLLAFDAADVDLIYAGLEYRAAHPADTVSMAAK